MNLRTRTDVFSAALFSALGLSQLVACGGSAFDSGGSAGSGTGGTGATGGTPSGGSAGTAAGGRSAGGTSAGGSTTGGTSEGGSASGGTSAGGSGSGGHGGSASGGSGNRFPCNDAGGPTTTCSFRHRPSAAVCASTVPRPEPYPNPTATAQCKSDADCTAQPHGWCGASGGQVPGPLCNYGCVQDSECVGGICECGDPVGRCVTATCTTDASCAPGFLCRSYDQSRGCGFMQYTCQSPADECGSDADCVGSPGGNLCWFDPTLKHFACVSGGCAIGRPFLVEGKERLAPPVRRSDWRELTPGLRVAELAGALPARLAREWTRIALMEHASIAAFARFTLQLMSLGAPPELIERATSAMADETKHAKACFALASAYAGEPVGPGNLAVERSLDQMSLAEIVLTTIREGCVGETVAAIEAREAAEHAADPQVRALLLMIAEDETRHAELAFHFLKWTLARGDAALHAAVRSEFEALQRETESRPSGLDLVERELLDNGVIPQPLRDAIRTHAIADVILPCAHALLAAEPAGSSAVAYGVAS